MGRSRSNSPARHRDRDRERRDDRSRHERGRERDHERRRKRSRSRSRSRRRRSVERDHRHKRDYSRSRSLEKDSRRHKPNKGRKHPTETERPAITAADLEGKSAEEQEMMRVMGFCNFDTTKGKKIAANDVGEVHVILKRKYRQYMNRKGGFNRPLDFVA